MKKISISPDKLQEWAGMTDNNEHIDVRIEIAKYFGLEYKRESLEHDFVGAYEHCKLIQERFQCATFPIYVIVDDAMIERIRREYGGKVAEQVCACL